MSGCRLVQATPDDVNVIVKLIMDMSDELQEFSPEPSIVKESIAKSFSENVFWFLFHDDAGVPFGTCYMQSVHNYWRLEKRFYLGGFYIAPAQRGRGYFKALNGQLLSWVKDQGGIQIYAHIHKDNQKSIQAFQSVGMEELDYRLYAHHWGD